MTPEELEAEEKRQVEIRNLVAEACKITGRKIPQFSETWWDVHRRRHVAPLRADPTSRRHDYHNANCWCEPVVVRETIIHLLPPDA